MGFSSLAVMGAGAAQNVVGSYFSAKGQKTSLNFQADIADQNARIAELGAQSELSRGQREEQNTRLKTAQLKSTQRANMAANGVDLGEGSALNVLTTTDAMGEIDANTVAANAVRSAWGYRTQATNEKNEASMKRATASGVSPGSAAFSSLLSQSGKVASSWYTMNKAGAFNKPEDGLARSLRIGVGAD